MKKVAIAMVAALAVFSTSQAQLKPEAGSIGLGFRVTGLANVAISNWMNSGVSGTTLPDPDGQIAIGGFDVDAMIPQEMMFGRYYLSSDLALRFGLGINSMSYKSEGWDSVGSDVLTWDDSWKGFSFGISAGVEKHFASAASRLDPYAGAMLNFASIGTISREYNDNLDSDPAISNANTYSIAGGSHFSIGLLAGFNYFFSDNIAVGGEFGWGFGSTNVGGDWESVETNTAGGTTTTTTRIGSEKMGMGGFGVMSTGGVNLSIFW